jgi:hypothetical protein
MNSLCLSVNVISSEVGLEMDGIKFSMCAFVTPVIDGLNLLREPDFDGSSLFFDELERSLDGSGKYLIFTCACGIAEDAGWSYVNVLHENETVTWKIDHGPSLLEFKFAHQQYKAEIESCRMKIERLSPKITLEPTDVVFPVH